jgi:hypothetical protein
LKPGLLVSILPAGFQEREGMLPGFTLNIPAHPVLAEVFPNELIVPYRFPVQFAIRIQVLLLYVAKLLI